MKRTGNKVEGFYSKDNAWQRIGPIGSITDPTLGAKKEFLLTTTLAGLANTFGKQDVKVAYDNFLASLVPANAVIANILDYYFTKVGAWERYSYTTPSGYGYFKLILTKLASGPYAGKYRLSDYRTPDPSIPTWQIFDWSADRSLTNIYADSLKAYNPARQLPSSNPLETLITSPFDTSTQWYFKKLASYTVPAGTFNDVLAWVNLDENFGPNAVNNTLGLNVPFGVTGVTWYARGLGEIAKLDVDAATGNTTFNYQLTSHGLSFKGVSSLMMLLLN